MKEIVWRVKKGWVYLLGIFLILNFVYLGLQESDIKASGVESNSPQKENQSVSEDTESKNAGSQNTVTSSATPKNSKDEGSRKTSFKYVTKTIPVQTNTAAVTNQPVQTPVVPPVQKDSVDVKISGFGTYTVELKSGDTAFDALKRAASQNGFSLEYKVYSFGVMISKIGSTEAQGTYYWALYYNGGYSSVGASDLKLKNKDVTEWRYETWQ